eukprot:21259-Heterococcus_DN1.PRE.6
MSSCMSGTGVRLLQAPFQQGFLFCSSSAYSSSVSLCSAAAVLLPLLRSDRCLRVHRSEVGAHACGCWSTGVYMTLAQPAVTTSIYYSVLQYCSERQHHCSSLLEYHILCLRIARATDSVYHTTEANEQPAPRPSLEQ